MSVFRTSPEVEWIRTSGSHDPIDAYEFDAGPQQSGRAGVAVDTKPCGGCVEIMVVATGRGVGSGDCECAGDRLDDCTLDGRCQRRHH